MVNCSCCYFMCFYHDNIVIATFIAFIKFYDYQAHFNLLYVI